MTDKKEKAHEAIFVRIGWRDRVNKVAEANGRTALGQIEVWTKREEKKLEKVK